jgi:hypothetical protein
VSADRPINADVPVPGGPDPEPPEAPEVGRPAPKPVEEKAKQPKPSPAKSRAPKGKRRRQPIPGALKAIAALVLVAVVFIVAAVIGGSGGAKDESGAGGPAPAPGEASSEAPSDRGVEELGYPSFATGNTTRVGGSDPAANAAGVALAVFPSTTDAQRPAAVVLADEDDWSGAIAAAVLMAAPVRAPLLFSNADGVPEVSAEAFDALDPQGDKATRGAAVFAIGDVATPDGGGDALAVRTGAAAAPAALAMPAAAWAARSGDPVLFAAGDRLPAPTLRTLKQHKGVAVYVLGPSSAISSQVVREVAGVGNEVHRVSGEDAVSNAIAFARYADGGFGWNINDPGHGFVLARADSPLDAAAAAPLSASGTWGPLLLTDSPASLPAPLREYFLDVKPGYTTNPTRAFYNHVWVIGDQEAIDVNQQAEVNALAELAKIGGGG